MTVYQLNRDEITELKQRHYSNNHSNFSYEEMALIDTLVTDEEIYQEYEGTIFSIDDFFCNSNNKTRNEVEENEL